jgi:hypothetical protein
MGATNARLNAAFRTAARLGPERTAMSRLRARVDEYLGSSNLAFERNYLMVRPAIAVSMIVAVLISGSELPGRDGLIRASGVAIAYNFLIAYFIARRRMYLLRASSLCWTI